MVVLRKGTGRKTTAKKEAKLMDAHSLFHICKRGMVDASVEMEQVD